MSTARDDRQRRDSPARVSACLIVKNEAHNLPDCIGPLRTLFDEIVVIDTGSTDGSADIARQLGARVFPFTWVDSFAAARNESLRHATGEWVFWLDADDRLDADNCAKLAVLLQALPAANVGFVMKCLCLPDPVSQRSTTVDHVRLFRHHPALRWRYRVHEQILPSLKDLGGTVRWSDVVIHHTGYQDAALRQSKLERDFRLLGLDYEDYPGDSFVLFNLGMILHEWRRFAEALPYLTESLARSHPGDSIVRKLYALIVQCQHQIGRFDEALATCRSGRQHYPRDTELLFHESVVLKVLGDGAASEGCLLDLLYMQEGEHFASVNPELRSLARHNLAVLCREQERDGEAESHWQAAIAESPGQRICWIGLAELYLSQERWAEFEQALGWLANDLHAAVLRARALLARREFDAARRLLTEVIARDPAALLPRVVLSYVLLQEGHDLVAAEQALEGVLALCPDHAEARRNLTVLRRQRAAQGA